MKATADEINDKIKEMLPEGASYVFVVVEDDGLSGNRWLSSRNVKAAHAKEMDKRLRIHCIEME